ncbi:hypothetical protein CIK62_13870 [Brevibacterium aurantiacum]|uniref:Uncharacterized protein n=1 Tax=Brevibacterium aurantiacum TaxID=273384 RepID=A0A2A3ZC93_BREAU|nr:hypothetical protein CIK62_13870 [Brevibacterium aurantiacum]
MGFSLIDVVRVSLQSLVFDQCLSFVEQSRDSVAVRVAAASLLDFDRHMGTHEDSLVSYRDALVGDICDDRLRSVRLC